MTDEEASKEIDRQEKRFAGAGFGKGLRLEKSAREYYQTIVKRLDTMPGVALPFFDIILEKSI